MIAVRAPDRDQTGDNPLVKAHIEIRCNSIEPMALNSLPTAKPKVAATMISR